MDRIIFHTTIEAFAAYLIIIYSFNNRVMRSFRSCAFVPSTRFYYSFSFPFYCSFGLQLRFQEGFEEVFCIINWKSLIRTGFMESFWRVSVHVLLNSKGLSDKKKFLETVWLVNSFQEKGEENKCATAAWKTRRKLAKIIVRLRLQIRGICLNFEDEVRRDRIKNPSCTFFASLNKHPIPWTINSTIVVMPFK